MKLPHWVVVSLLSVSLLAAIVAAGWWWVTWPERTAREFVERLTSAPAEPSRNEMILRDEGTVVTRVIRTWPPKDWSDVESQRRSLLDVLVGRHRFKIAGEFGWDFTAERARVIGRGPENDGIIVAILQYGL